MGLKLLGQDARPTRPIQGDLCYLYILSIFEAALIRRTASLPFSLFLFTKPSSPSRLDRRCSLSRKPRQGRLTARTTRSVTCGAVSATAVAAIGCSLSELTSASRSFTAARAAAGWSRSTSPSWSYWRGLPEKKKKKGAISAEEEGPDCNFVIV
ncbi:hypothetical protein M9H77_12251 [Catharanthus roseus]|uniref:Uncharacterized protein n=1 Tax=Catharanthus roseus TaxID=4058 RepID=A0ACC0BGV4_CATRO|nr:hypothetical protein M9H77_12251 [Catharanthus roseus]